MQGVAQTKPEPQDDGSLAPINPGAATISRRGLLAMLGAASLTILGVQVGESIGGPFRRLALLAPRGRVFGTGANDFPVTHTAEYAEVTSTITSDDWRLTVAGARSVSFSREQLLAMPSPLEPSRSPAPTAGQLLSAGPAYRSLHWHDWSMQATGRSCVRGHSNRE